MSSSPAKYILFTFKNVSDAGKALYKIKDRVNARLIPLPPEIDEGCGNTLRISYEDFDKVMEILDRKDFVETYTFTHVDGKRKVEKYVF